MKFQDFDLSQASESYLLANTPLFLIRKLQTDPIVQDISRSFSSKDILDALKISLRRYPSSIEEAVWPYLLVTALFLNGNTSDLQEAAGLTATNSKWYNYVAATLLARSSPLSHTTVDVPLETSPKVVEWSDLPTSIATVSLVIS